jgi:hypothetical protein
MSGIYVVKHKFGLSGYVCWISVYVANTYSFGMVLVNLELDFCVLKTFYLYHSGFVRLG